MGNEKQKGKAFALLPIGVFLVIFLGAGILFKDFYAMPAVVAFLIALFVAFLQNRKVSFQKKMEVIAKGLGEENIITMCLIFLCAGAFSGAVTAAGGVDSTVNLGLSLIPPHFAVAGLFIIGCFISVSMGTSVGTITALAPIAVGISKQTGFSMAICVAAVVCGAMFGDNLSMISDTTIAAVKTQGCEMKDKFKMNFLIVLPAAIITVVFFWFVTRNVAYDITENLDYNFWQVVPYLVVLIGALIGINVFLVLIGGTVISLIAGVATGNIVLADMFTVVGDGVVHGAFIAEVVADVVALHIGVHLQVIVEEFRSQAQSGGHTVHLGGLDDAVGVGVAHIYMVRYHAQRAAYAQVVVRADGGAEHFVLPVGIGVAQQGAVGRAFGAAGYHSLTELVGAHCLICLAGSVHIEVGGEVDLRLARFALLGGDDDHTVGCTRTVDGC